MANINIEQFICDLYEKQLEGSIKKNHIADCLQKQGFKVTDGKLVEIGKKPKFKVGDWITNCDYTWKIVEVKPLDYILQSQDGNIVDDTISYVDTNFHLWTVQDAKDGDVLCTPNGNLFIFKKITENRVYSYCGLFFRKFDETKGCVNGELATELPSDYVPATKEQCDFLFQKMKEAGYEWDAENKKLVELKECITILKSEYNFLLSCKQRLIEMHKTEIQKCYNEIKTNVVSSIVNSSK